MKICLVGTNNHYIFYNYYNYSDNKEILDYIDDKLYSKRSIYDSYTNNYYEELVDGLEEKDINVNILGHITSGDPDSMIHNLCINNHDILFDIKNKVEKNIGYSNRLLGKIFLIY